MNIKILVDSEEFWECLQRDVLSAKDYVYVQTLSFEGDSVGKRLCRLLLSSSADDRKVLVDSYTKFILNDKFIFAPSSIVDTTLRKKVVETTAMLRNLDKNGVRVKFTNPAGLLLRKFARRNHKKLIVIDKVVYIGGINFSEHNFHWHDMMLRIEDQDIATFLKDDFLSTWSGKNSNTSKHFGGVQFLIFNGYSNEFTFRKILNLIGKAKDNVFVESPYLTYPFYDKLREVRRKGVPVTIIAPEANNWKFLDRYTRWEAIRSGFDLRLYKGRMTHLKVMLLDEDYLVVGSSNFDYLSYNLHQEIIAVINKPDVISSFKEKVLKVDLKNSSKFGGHINSLSGQISNLMLRSLGKVLVFMN